MSGFLLECKYDSFLLLQLIHNLYMGQRICVYWQIYVGSIILVVFKRLVTPIIIARRTASHYILIKTPISAHSSSSGSISTFGFRSNSRVISISRSFLILRTFKILVLWISTSNGCKLSFSRFFMDGHFLQHFVFLIAERLRRMRWRYKQTLIIWVVFMWCRLLLRSRRSLERIRRHIVATRFAVTLVVVGSG